jgi:SAM-dependent methyltransferase
MPESLLKRIISASSKPGDCVLDPFCGSGTTAAAAIALGRDFITMDISPNYVARARRRLEKLKKQLDNNGFPNSKETVELTRLVSDFNMPAEVIAADKKLLGLFQRQFRLRTANGKKYHGRELTAALKKLQGVRIP